MLFEKIALTGQTYCTTSNSRNNKFLPFTATASDIFDQYYWDDSMKYVHLLEDWVSKYGNGCTDNLHCLSKAAGWSCPSVTYLRLRTSEITFWPHLDFNSYIQMTTSFVTCKHRYLRSLCLRPLCFSFIYRGRSRMEFTKMLFCSAARLLPQNPFTILLVNR